MKINKPLFYIVHIFKMCFYNKFRFFLSVIGLVVGLFVFTTGNILLDSYYNESIKNSMQMEEQVVALEYESSEKIDKYDICKEKSIETLEAVTSTEKNMIYYKLYENGSTCTLSARVEGVSDISNMLPIEYTDNDFLIAKPELVKGRLITEADVAQNKNVVVIDEFTESLLFEDGKSVGKTLNFNIRQSGMAIGSEDDNTEKDVSCTVIGVVKNSYNTLGEEMKYKKFLQNPTESLRLNTTVYCPITFADNNFEISDKRLISWLDNNSHNLENIKQMTSFYKDHSLRDFGEYKMFDRNSVIDKAKEDLEPIRLFLVFIMVILLLISGINAMSTMFFSVKERINEIGIKKALGATKVEILNQFIIEGILMTVIAAVFTVIISSLTALAVQWYLNSILFVLFEISFSASNLLTPIFLSIIYGFIFSIVPSYYGAKIKVTDSLRFE